MKQISLSALLLAGALAAHSQSWTNRFHGPLARDEEPIDMAVDGNGNVIVTGYIAVDDVSIAYATIKYSAAGIPVWTNYYPGSPTEQARPAAVGLDTTGNVFVTGRTGPKDSAPPADVGDYVTIKYSGAGLPLWTNRYDGAGYADIATALAMDGDGNAIVTGVSDDLSPNPFTGEDWATVKYFASGDTAWINEIRTSEPDQAKAVAVDRSGNLIVTGRLGGTNCTMQYSPFGDLVWSKDGPAWSGDAVAVDADDNVVTTGYTVPPGGGATILKYSSSGVPLWTNYYNLGIAWAALALDPAGNILVSGTDTTGTVWEFVTIKYSPSGVPVWTNRCGAGPDFNFDRRPFLKADRNGNVVLCGTSGGSYDALDWLTVKYSAAGTALWTNRYGGPANGMDAVRGLAVDHDSNVLVMGQSWNGTNFDWVTVKYAAQIAAPILNIQRLTSHVVLSWTNAAFGLQSAPTIAGTFTNVPGATSPYTNTLSGGQRFFRLAQ